MNLITHQAPVFFSLLLLSGCAVHRRETANDWFKSSPGDNPRPQQHESLQEWGRWVHDPVKGWVADEWVLDPLRRWVRAVWDPQKGWVAQPPPTVMKREPLPEEPPAPPKPMVADKPEPEPQLIETAPRPPKPMVADKPEPEPQLIATQPPPPVPVVVATVPKAEMPNKKETSGGFPPLAFGLMPVCAAALWMGGRAAVRATRG
jgi:hypothetical protein